MKIFLGTVSVLGVALIAFLAFGLFSQKKTINELVLLSGLCIVDESRKVKYPEKFADCLEQQPGIDQSHYLIRIKRKDNDPNNIDRVAGKAPECAIPRYGGAQITQHIHLTPQEFKLFAKCRGFLPTSWHEPSPTPTP